MAKSVLSGLPNTIYKATKGLFRQGTLRRETPGGVDEYGDPTDPTVATFAFEGLREDYSAAFRNQAGIPQTDCRVLVIAGSITVEPAAGDKLQIESTWFQVRAIEEIDPARATYKLQCYAIPEPA